MERGLHDRRTGLVTGLSNGSVGTITIGGCLPPVVFRAAWECSRCHIINAPHVDHCSCAPFYPVVIPFWYPAESFQPEDSQWEVWYNSPPISGSFTND